MGAVFPAIEELRERRAMDLRAEREDQEEGE